MAANLIRCPGCGVNMDLSTFPVRPEQVVCPRCQTRCAVPPDPTANGAPAFQQPGYVPASSAPTVSFDAPGQQYAAAPYASPQMQLAPQMQQQTPAPMMQQAPQPLQQASVMQQPSPAPQMQQAPQPVYSQVPEPTPMPAPVPTPMPEPSMATVNYPQAAGPNVSQTADASLQPVIEPIAPMQLGSLGEPVVLSSYDASQAMGFEDLSYESTASSTLYTVPGYETEQTYVETEIIESTPEPLSIPEPPTSVAPPAPPASTFTHDTSGLDKSPFFSPQTPEKSKEDVFLLPIDAKGNTEPLAFAVIGFLSTIFMFPPLGLALCIIALSMGADEKRHNLYNSHRGLTTLFAVLGIVLNLAVLVVEILMVAIMGMTPAVILGYFL